MLEILDGKGPLTSTGVESLLYMKTNNSVNSDPNIPDIELIQSFATVAFDTCKSDFRCAHFSVRCKKINSIFFNLFFAIFFL